MLKIVDENHPSTCRVVLYPNLLEKIEGFRTQLLRLLFQFLSEALKDYRNKKVEHHVGYENLENYKESVARLVSATTNPTQLDVFEALTVRALELNASLTGQVCHQHWPVLAGARNEQTQKGGAESLEV